MANEYRYVHEQSHENYSHVDVTILRDDIAIATRRIATGDRSEKAEEDVLATAELMLESITLKIRDGESTPAEGRAEFEGLRIWR